MLLEHQSKGRRNTEHKSLKHSIVFAPKNSYQNDTNDNQKENLKKVN